MKGFKLVAVSLAAALAFGSSALAAFFVVFLVNIDKSATFAELNPGSP